jgi:hypothetical protein
VITSYAAIPATVAGEVVFFAFDNFAIPLQDNLLLTLQKAEKHPANPVLRSSEEGAPDDFGCHLYGSVIPIDGKLRMWYLALPKDGPGYGPMAYAESEDGVHWIKPNLGLVEWHGSRENNLCLIEAEETPVYSDGLCVLYDPEDPVADRRYKAAFIRFGPRSTLRALGGDSQRPASTMVTATSSDGLRWQLIDASQPALDEKFEVGSIYRFGGMYHASGQQVPPWVTLTDGRPCGRAVTVYQSPDFVHWSSAKSLAFVRPGYVPMASGLGAEIHLGASTWNRGNVLVGLYGIWHGAPGADGRPLDLRDVRIDLGLVVSNDGLHFREPVPNFTVIPRGDFGEDWDSVALLQGGAFANMGDKTYIWYSHWDCTFSGLHLQAIGLATLRRDSFGNLSRRFRGHEGHFITCPVQFDTPVQIYINAEGLSPNSPLLVEVLNAQNRPLSGYTSEDCVPVTEAGLRQIVRWKHQQALTIPSGEMIKIRVILAGSGESEQRVWALYLAEA